MLIQLARDLPDYFYDVFVTRLDFWVVFGIIAQLVFGSRFILQWIASERAGRSVMPLSFWFLSILGGLMTLVYGFVRREPAQAASATASSVWSVARPSIRIWILAASS